MPNEATGLRPPLLQGGKRPARKKRNKKGGQIYRYRWHCRIASNYFYPTCVYVFVTTCFTRRVHGTLAGPGGIHLSNISAARVRLHGVSRSISDESAVEVRLKKEETHRYEWTDVVQSHRKLVIAYWHEGTVYFVSKTFTFSELFVVV